MILAISGTPGTGKTYIAKKIAKSCPGMKYFDLNRYIKDNRLFDSYDRKAKTYDVDVKKLKKRLTPILKSEHSKDKSIDRLTAKEPNNIDVKTLLRRISKSRPKGIIIDSHLSHNLDSDYCIIVQSDIKNLNRRLQSRDYPKKKVQENIESEIFQICLEEAEALQRKIIIVNN